jgi:hypothetical protein
LRTERIKLETFDYSQGGVRMLNARLAEASDLTSLVELYVLSEVSCRVKRKEKAERIWSEMLSHEGVAAFVSTAGAKTVASCMIITTPNLLRVRQHGFPMQLAIFGAEAHFGHSIFSGDIAIARK